MLDTLPHEGETGSSWERHTRAIISAVGWVLSSGPASFFVSLVLFALHIRLYLGRWPVVYRDTPQTWLLSLHEYGLVVPTLYLAVYGLPVWLVVAPIILGFRRMPTRAFKRQVASILIGILGVVLLVVADPTGFVEWFLD